jgi:sulfate adenylyltransferase subunit 1 (EFTu-like GTPase family)
MIKKEENKIVKEIKEYSAKTKKQGKCIQCQHPWYDGLCECGLSTVRDQGIEIEIVKKYFSIGKDVFVD